jgi:hypothetical protein
MHQERQWQLDAERLGGLEVDDQLEPGWVLHGQIGGLRALEYAVDIERRSPPDVSAIGPIGNETSVRREVTVRIDCRFLSRASSMMRARYVSVVVSGITIKPSMEARESVSNAPSISARSRTSTTVN